MGVYMQIQVIIEDIESYSRGYCDISVWYSMGIGNESIDRKNGSVYLRYMRGTDEFGVECAFWEMRVLSWRVEARGRVPINSRWHHGGLISNARTRHMSD